MSAQSLKKYLEELQRELEQNTAGPYREAVANKRPHRFRFNPNALKEETLKEIKLRDANIPITEEDEAFILGLAKTMQDEVEIKLKQIAARSGDDSRVFKNQHGISFKFSSSTDTGLVNHWTTPDDIFDKVRQSYSPALQNYFDDLQEYLKAQYFTNPETGREKSKGIRTGRVQKGEFIPGKNFLQAKGKLTNAGHLGEQGVFETLMRDLSDNVLARGFHVVDEGGDKLSQNDLRKDLKKLGINIKLIRKDNSDEHIIVLESGTDNKKRGQGLRQQMLKDIEAAIQKLKKGGNDLANLKGSDSIVEKKRKILIKNTVSKFDKIKGVTTKTEKTTLKKSSSAPAKKSISPKVAPNTKGITKKVKVKTKRPRANVTAVKSKTSMTYLIGVFNKELPRIVQGNMKDPRLNYRTGRFASSVRVTDVIETPQGFPSVGYTYQKNPYQTFEQGFLQGSANRDPRALIDSSIREIAIQFAIGRFYTRRV